MLYIFLLIIHFFRNTGGFFSTVECPSQSRSDIFSFNDFNVEPFDCILTMSCTHPFGISNNPAEESSHCPDGKFHNDDFPFGCLPDNSDTCEMKHKVTLIKNWDFPSNEDDPCRYSPDSSSASLWPFPGNCSLFYKCDWGSTVVFECPQDLHFNRHLQVCDWPWQAQCDFTSNDCPRPHPRCPSNYDLPVYLPHPHLCDHFYQCEWGVPRLQTCPTGLHFSPGLKICDWPYKAHCQIC